MTYISGQWIPLYCGASGVPVRVGKEDALPRTQPHRRKGRAPRRQELICKGEGAVVVLKQETGVHFWGGAGERTGGRG